MECVRPRQGNRPDRNEREPRMATAAASETLLTAEQFAQRPDPGYPEELVRGRIVPMPQPNRRHGQICAKVVYILRHYTEDHDIGHVLSNDAGVITERD